MTIRTIIATIGAQRPSCTFGRTLPFSVGVSLAIVTSVRRAASDDGADDPPLGQLLARDLVDDDAARHDDDSIADARQLDRIARLDEHRRTLGGLVAQGVV